MLRLITSTTKGRPNTGFFASIQYRFKERIDQEEKKAAARENEKFERERQCAIPDELTDNAVLLKDPVLLPCGHCVNGTKLKSVNTYTCTKDQKEFKREEGIPSDLLKDFIALFHKKRSEILNCICTMTDKNNHLIENEIAAYKQFTKELLIQFAASKALIIRAKEVYEAVPEEFSDTALLGSLFEDPFLTKHGYVFEKNDLMQWVREHGNCPASRQPLSLHDINFPNAEDLSFQKEIKKIIRDYKKDRAAFLHLITSKKMDENGITEYQKRTQLKIASFEKTKKDITLDPLIKTLHAAYRDSGLPATTKTEEEFNADLPVLSSDKRWVPKKLALERNMQFTEYKEIAEKLWNLNNGLISLQKCIKENPCYELQTKIKELAKLNEEIKFKSSQIQVTEMIRKMLSTAYRNSGLPFPPIHPDNYHELVLLESGQWERKQTALEQMLSTVKSQLIENNCREWRTFHASVYELEKKISTAAPLTSADQYSLEQTIQELTTTHIRLSTFLTETSIKYNTMEKIKQKLQIDLKNESHLITWAARNNSCWHGQGGVEVKFQDPATKAERSYRVPTRARELMHVAKTVTLDEGVDIFSERIHQNKSKKPSCLWSNFFSWMTRHAETQKLYDYPENLRLSEFEFKL